MQNNSVPRRRHRIGTSGIQRAVWVVLAALLTSLALFGGYYYWDRYLRFRNPSPLDLNIQHLEEAVRAEPDSPEPRVALAEYYLAKGMWPEGLQQANQVLSAYPDNQGALLVAGIIYVRMGDPGSAVAPLERFVDLRKEQPMAGIDTALESAYYFLGESYLKLKRTADGIAALQAALVITPTDADALYQLGVGFQTAGNHGSAVEHFHRAVRLVPDFAEAYAGMAESYTALGQPDYVAYARGMQAYSQEDFHTAQSQLEFATQALPAFGPAFVGLGLTYEKLGKLDSALVAIDRALEMTPDDLVAQQARARIQQTMAEAQR